MRHSSIWNPCARVIASAIVIFAAGNVLAAPQIFWASDPVRPNETILLQGGDFGGQVTVEMARLDDGAERASGGTPLPPPTNPTDASKVKTWTRVPVLQASDCSLKFVVPADWKMGVYACRVASGGATSQPRLINAPDPWWLQGDRGRTVTPGGWLRVFGKSLSFDKPCAVRLRSESKAAIDLKPEAIDGYALRLKLPADLEPGTYAVSVHNGLGGDAAWQAAGQLRVVAPAPWPAEVFSVLDSYGADAVAQSRKTLSKYSPVPDRTQGIHAALRKAKQNGGGIVYFPAGRYGVEGDLDVPPRTILRGEGMGLVVLWWGKGRFNLDGGSDQGLETGKQHAVPSPLIHGSEFGIEEMSIYLPLAYETAISSGERFQMRKVRVRIDHYWALDGRKRPDGVVAQLGNNAEVTDCDILAKGAALVPRDYCWIARNRIMAGKTNCPLGGAEQAIVEDNQFVSLYPTAYQNIAGRGRNLYYARNRHEAFHVHQADYSFTFDAGDAAYFGRLATVHGTQLTLAEEPTYPNWAPEKSDLWRHAIVCVQDGRGAGQWRNVVANHGRQWTIDRAFDCPPDDSSLVTIVPMNGRVLVVGNRFEDANWVNASYGTAIDVIFAENRLYRCAQLLNYGCAPDNAFQPSWYVQFLDNELHEGNTSLDTSGHVRDVAKFPCPITRCTISRRNVLGSDNSGGITVSGRTRDVIVEGCVLRNPMSTVRVQPEVRDVLLRNNRCEPVPVADH